MVLNRFDTCSSRFSTLKWLKIFLWVGALISTVKPSIPAIRASFGLLMRKNQLELGNKHGTLLENRRLIQAHYLSYGVYIPINDILIRKRQIKTSISDTYEVNCPETCLQIWVPLKFKFPILGDKVFEWNLTKS